MGDDNRVKRKSKSNKKRQQETEKEVPTKDEDTSEQLDDLDATREQLKSMKKEYLANLHDLQSALDASKGHLQTNYELITALKHDKQKLVLETETLQRQFKEQSARLEKSMAERKQWETQNTSTDVDSRTFHKRMHELVEKEKVCEQESKRIHSRLEQAINTSEQCQMALRQATEQMEVENSKHMALRQDYQDHVDRLTSLNEALEKCKLQHIHSSEVIKEMNERYNNLKSEMKEHMDYRKQHEQEHVKTLEEQRKLDMTPKEYEEHMARQHNIHHSAITNLHVCNQKNETCLAASRDQNEYVQKLEDEIRKALKVLKSKTSTKSTNDQQHLDQLATLKEQEIVQLQQQVETMSRENENLREQTRNFEKHFDSDNELLQRHSRLKLQHEKALAFIDELKQSHKELRDRKLDVSTNLDQTNFALNESEEKMQQTAAEIRDLDSKGSALRDRISKCMYPGEKERLESQLDDLIRERDQMRQNIAQSTEEHAKLHKQMQDLVKENEDLKIIKQRFEMDAEQMQRIVTQSAEMNVELTNSRRLLDKKEKQLNLLSNQLSAMLHRVKTLEEREAKLQEKLQKSASPEEMDSLLTHLSTCRNEMKVNKEKFDALKTASTLMQEQITLSQNKVASLVQVIQESENVRKSWEREKRERELLQVALKDCGQGKQVDTARLQERIKTVEDMYSESLVTHERMMSESNARIAQLQQQLKASPSTAGLSAPKLEKEVTTDTERRVDEHLARLQTEINSIKAEEARTQKTTEMAIKAASIQSAADTQKLQFAHQQAMREKEKQIMATRDKTYDALLQTLDTANQSPNTNPNDLYRQIKDIRVHGATREQQAMADMLRLKAINAKLTAEYQAAKNTQAELLHRANIVQRNEILQNAGTVPPEVLNRNVQAYQALMNANRDYIGSVKQDVRSQLIDQQQYISELERQLPKMDDIQRKMNLQRFPDLNALQTQIQQEKRFTIGAVGYETSEATNLDRTQSALEMQLKAADASVRGMTDQVKRYISQPSSDNLKGLRDIAQASPGQIESVLRQNAALQDRSASRYTIAIQERSPTLGPPGEAYAANMSTATVQIQPDKKSPPMRYHADQVEKAGKDSAVFAPTSARAASQIQNGKDIVVVTYSFQPSGNQSIKFALFMAAINQLSQRLTFPLSIQLVRILPGNVRFDLLTNANLQNNCNYETCNLTLTDVGSLSNLQEILQSKLQKVKEDENKDFGNHIVLSITLRNSSHIHITDILYFPDKMPSSDDIKLLDGSWIKYLDPVLKNPSSKIDLFANQIPFEVSDRESLDANARLLQVTQRIDQYLKQIKMK